MFRPEGPTEISRGQGPRSVANLFSRPGGATEFQRPFRAPLLINSIVPGAALRLHPANFHRASGAGLIGERERRNSRGMSELPEGWARTNLADIGRWSSGGTPSRSGADYFGQGIPWVKSGDLTDGLITRTEEQITVLGLKNSSAKLMPRGTISIALYGATIGKLGLLGFPAATNQACANVVPNKELIKPQYLFFYLMSERKTLIDKGQGGAQPNISQEIVKAHPIVLPPLNEQRRIVTKLEKLLSRVDAAQARLATIPRTLKRFRQSVLAAACSGRLTASWRRTHSNNEPAPARLAKIKQARLALVRSDVQAAKISKTFSEIESQADVVAPRGWLILRAESICDFITKGTTPNTKEITSNGEVPFLKVQHIIDNKLEFWSLPCFVPNEIHNGVLKRSKVFPRDVLMNIVGPPLNKVAIVPNDFPEWNINQALAIFRPVEGVEPEYLQLILSHEETLEHVLQETRGIVGQSNISLEQCRDLLILLPTQAEQQEIIRRVKALFKTADALEARYRKAKTHVDRLTQSILAKAFRGDLVPQDPNDEPASALLERIRQTRDATGVKKRSVGR